MPSPSPKHHLIYRYFGSYFLLRPENHCNHYVLGTHNTSLGLPRLDEFLFWILSLMQGAARGGNNRRRKKGKREEKRQKAIHTYYIQRTARIEKQANNPYSVLRIQYDRAFSFSFFLFSFLIFSSEVGFWSECRIRTDGVRNIVARARQAGNEEHLRIDQDQINRPDSRSFTYRLPCSHSFRASLLVYLVVHITSCSIRALSVLRPYSATQLTLVELLGAYLLTHIASRGSET